MDASDRSELAVRLRAEYRAERRAEEYEALRQQWAERTVVQVAHELARRGDEVMLRWPSLALQGRIRDAGRDWFALATARETMVVHLPASSPSTWPELEITHRVASGGRAPEGREPTFRAYLRSFAFAQQLDPRRLVSVTTAGRPAALHVLILACAEDHLYARDGQREYVLPLTTIRLLAWSDVPAGEAGGGTIGGTA